MGYYAINSHARWGTDGASISWNQNCAVNITGVGTSDDKILLMQVDVPSGKANDITAILQYSKDGGTFTTLTDATNWIYQVATAFNDGDATTLAICAAPNGTWHNGEKDENNLLSTLSLAADEYSEFIFSIRATNAGAGVYRFRLWDTAEGAEIPIGGNLAAYIQATVAGAITETITITMGHSDINSQDSEIMVSDCAVKDEILSSEYIQILTISDCVDKSELLTSQIVNTPILKLIHKEKELFKEYIIGNKTLIKSEIFPYLIRGLDFSLAFIHKDTYNIEHIQGGITLSLTKSKSLKPSFIIQSNILFSKSDMFVPYLSGNVPRSTFLTDLDISTLYPSLLIENDNYILEYEEAGIILSLAKNKTFKPLFEIQFDLLSSSPIEFVPIINIPIALTTLSFAKTKSFSSSFLFDNFISSVNDLVFSSYFQSDAESLLSSTISFDDVYFIWKIIVLSFSKDLNFRYNQIQDFEIDLKISQLLSEILILTPTIAEIRRALKEILTFAKQIDVLATSNQIKVTTTVKQIEMLTSGSQKVVTAIAKQIPISISTQMA